MLFSAAETRRLPENDFSGSLLIAATAKTIILPAKRQTIKPLAKRAYSSGNETL
ncbi:hypothetical protein EIKCOROL_01346 [Eikenella corrodens ATCC 23834]|uniref:Uncharacterized protein n=1 Tax=Eikenella corrodens ATCC 23834 TaxID=546274 RepID=C0DVF7_EIKCO|nr:hypothetical protein EIKCOROL_01346 [Eikenella corrodens ATCC 23834]